MLLQNSIRPNQNKILFEICQQFDAHPNVNNLSDGSLNFSSISSDDNDNNITNLNTIDLLHLSPFKEDGQSEEYQNTNGFLKDDEQTVFSGKINLLRTATLQNWEGTCYGTRAQSTLIGLPQAFAYCRIMNLNFNQPKEIIVSYLENMYLHLGKHYYPHFIRWLGHQLWACCRYIHKRAYPGWTWITS